MNASTRSRSFSLRVCVAVLTAANWLLLVSVATAASDVWDGDGASPPSGVWGADVNWVDDTTPGNGDTATFNVANTYNVTFDADPAAIQALFASAGNVTFASSGGAQTLEVNSGGGQDVTVNGGATLSLGTSGNPLHLTVGDDLIVNVNGTLNVNFGSQVNTTDLIAQTTSTNATIVVDGTGSALNRTGTGQRAFGNSNGTVSLTYRNNASGDHNDTLIVGNISDVTGAAVLNVESDADLTLDSLTLGFGTVAGPTGTATVTGGGSTITQSGASLLTIGRASGNGGILNVNSSGVFTTGTGPIALNTTGRINIGGGTLNANGNLTMASGSILNFNGGTLNPNAGINILAGATFNFNSGQMTVDGGESVTSAGALTVGSAGIGTLNIEDQGVVHVGTALSINSTSNVNLNGGTLRFNTISGLNRLNYNSGTIQLAGNRTIGDFIVGDSTIAGLFGVYAFVTTGRSLAIEGNTVVELGLVVQGGKFTSQDLFVHAPGGIMAVMEGGTAVTNDARVGDLVGGGPNTVYVGGPGSSWTNDDLYLGENSNASLVIEDQGLVDLFSLHLESQGVVILNGGTLRLQYYYREPGGFFSFRAGTVQLKGNRTIGLNWFVDFDLLIDDLFGIHPTITSQKNLTIEGTATLLTTVTIDGGTFSVGQLVNGHNLHFQRGTLNITNQAVTIGSSGPLGDTLDLANDMTVNVALGITNQGLVTGDGEIGGTFANAAAGELRADPGKSLKLTGSGNANAGQIELLGGALDFEGNLTNNVGAFISGNGSLITGGLTNHGTMNFAGTTNIVGDVVNSAGGKIISGGGGATIFYDDVTNDGEIRTSTNGFTVFFGAVDGAGAFTGTGTVNFEGDLSPGNSPAVVQFAGDVVLGPDATLQIELGGALPGQYDQIQVAGELTLDGALELLLIDGFTPSAGQTFDILNWGSLAGAFSSVELPSLAGFQWDVSQLSTGVLSVTPAFTADFDGDVDVDGDDLAQWTGDFGLTGDSDADSDGDSDGADFLAWQRQLGGPASVAQAMGVPEPATGWLLAVAFLGARPRRRQPSATRWTTRPEFPAGGRG